MSVPTTGTLIAHLVSGETEPTIPSWERKSEAMLPQNVAAAAALQAELEPMILGTELPARSCSCGTYGSPATVATEVLPAGKEEQYSGQEVAWYMWFVRMEPRSGEHGHGYSISLSTFIPVDELQALFAKHFGDQAH